LFLLRNLLSVEEAFLQSQGGGDVDVSSHISYGIFFLLSPVQVPPLRRPVWEPLVACVTVCSAFLAEIRRVSRQSPDLPAQKPSFSRAFCLRVASLEGFPPLFLLNCRGQLFSRRANWMLSEDSLPLFQRLSPFLLVQTLTLWMTLFPT